MSKKIYQAQASSPSEGAFSDAEFAQKRSDTQTTRYPSRTPDVRAAQRAIAFHIQPQAQAVRDLIAHAHANACDVGTAWR